MHNNKNYYLYLILSLPLLFSLCLTKTYAGGTSVNGIGARAETMQAFNAVADDPSAIFYNPAGITQIKGIQAEGSIGLLRTEQNYTNALNGVKTNSTTYDPAPALFIVDNDLQNITLGIGLYAPFARHGDYGVNAASFFSPLMSTLVRIDLVPTIAFNVGPYISVGIGIVGSYVKSDLKALGLYDTASGTGATGQIGVLIKPNNVFKLGITFRGQEITHLSGDSTFNFASSGFDSNLRFPNILSIGAAWRVVPEVTIAGQFDEEFWGNIQRIRKKYYNPLFDAKFGVIQLNARNTQTYRLGAIYRYNPQNEFRVGWAYATNATPQTNIFPIILDFSGNIYDIGYSRYFRNCRLDLGYEYSYANPRTGGTVFPGHYTLNIHTILLGFNYYFGGAKG